MNENKYNSIKPLANNVELDKNKKELSSEQKISLARAWVDMIVDGEDVPADIDKMEKNEIKQWLFESMMRDVEKLAGEFGLRIEDKMVDNIQKAENPEDRSVLELKYINDVHSQIDELVKGFDRSSGKSTKWDSWPKKMRESREFNCVGATLLGMYLLEKGGIKSYYANPSGHVLNIAKLSNGDWWYVDFRNGKENVAKIDAEEIKIGDTQVLKINQEGIDYHLIPICGYDETPGSVLGNLDSLKREADGLKGRGEYAEKEEAREYVSRYIGNFKEADFSFLHKSLYSKLIDVDKTREMREERLRISNIKSPYST